MDLDLPTPGWTDGPEWATKVNKALTDLATMKIDDDNLDAKLTTVLSDPESAASTELNNTFGGWVNVRSFGAVGDGVTDDYESIQAAVDEGGLVYLPPGVYLLSEGVRIPSFTTLVGAGVDRTILRQSAARESFTFVLTNASNTGEARAEPDVHIRVSDMTVDGNAWNIDAPYQESGDQNDSTIVFAGVEFGFVERVKAVNGFRHGIDIAASHFQDDSTDPIVGPSRFCVIRDCEVADWYHDDGITTHNSEYLLIENCYVHKDVLPYNSHSNGVELDEGSAHVTVRGVRSSGCTNAFAAKNHELSIPSHHITFVDCIAENAVRGFRVYDEYTGYDLNDVEVVLPTNTVSIVRCLVRNLRMTEGSPTSCKAVHLTQVQNVVIADLRVEDYDGEVIRYENSRGIRVRDVSVSGVVSTTAAIQEVTGAGSRNNSFARLTFEGGCDIRYAFDVVSCDGLEIDGIYQTAEDPITGSYVVVLREPAGYYNVRNVMAKGYSNSAIRYADQVPGALSYDRQNAGSLYRLDDLLLAGEPAGTPFVTMIDGIISFMGGFLLAGSGGRPDVSVNAETLLCVIPEEFRPRITHHFPLSTSETFGGYSGSVIVYADGEVRVRPTSVGSPGASTAMWSLQAVTYPR